MFKQLSARLLSLLFVVYFVVHLSNGRDWPLEGTHVLTIRSLELLLHKVITALFHYTRNKTVTIVIIVSFAIFKFLGSILFYMWHYFVIESTNCFNISRWHSFIALNLERIDRCILQLSVDEWCLWICFFLIIMAEVLFNLHYFLMVYFIY